MGARLCGSSWYSCAAGEQSRVCIYAAFSPAEGHVDNSQLWAVDSPHLLHPFGQHVCAGCAEVDVEHDDTDHHDHGHQHHAEEQEPVGHIQPGAPGGRGMGRGAWHGGVGVASLTCLLEGWPGT